MSDARDVILKHVAAMNDRNSDADPWAARCHQLRIGRPGEWP